jgi:hypothetical protein
VETQPLIFLGGNTMTGKEAIDALMLGKKVRCTGWVKDVYLYYDKKSLTVKDNNNKTQMSTCFDGFLSNIQWEVYEEEKEGNFMTGKEAIQALKDGKKIKRSWWVSGYIYFDQTLLCVLSDEGDTYRLPINMGDTKDWVLYEEPKKRIKVFISQPMHGRFKYEIAKERSEIKKVIEAKYGEEYVIEYLNEDNRERPKDWTRIQHLGYSIMNMHDADIVVFAPGWKEAYGCFVEHDVAYFYGKKIYTCVKEVDGEIRMY